ncbi:MAG TPA: T9SS type A sorting domain-containing protein, partial [Flavobacteriales bacterium]|nr:T9SS type A sorting domain-containing protein [Flavobacteriales bacterium]
PAINSIIVKSGLVTETELVMLNRVGQKLKSWPLQSGRNIFSIDDVPSGIYFLKTGEQTKKLVVQH